MKVRHPKETLSDWFSVLGHNEIEPGNTYLLYPDLDDWYLGDIHIWEGSYED